MAHGVVVFSLNFRLYNDNDDYDNTCDNDDNYDNTCDDDIVCFSNNST